MHQPTPADEPVDTTASAHEPSCPKQLWVAPVLDTLALGQTLAGAGIPGDLAATGAS
jgi:hypothetical protein